MYVITGAYVKFIFVDEFGVLLDLCVNVVLKEDFVGGYLDLNLMYVEEFVKVMFFVDASDFGVVFDGDGDRNMIFGNNFFVILSDFVVIIVVNVVECILYFKFGLKGLVCFMFIVVAFDRVVAGFGVECFEIFIGWKFFGNLMDVGCLLVCGEEFFGIGVDYVCEKDGFWVVFVWLFILAYRNKDVSVGGKKVSVE